MNKGIIKTISALILCNFLIYTTPIYAFTKEETVYSKTNANGENYKTIVSTHLQNLDSEEILKDMTDLINIENANGDETFTQDGEELIWAANGADIYYQGESQKELPIKCNIKYELDGKEISAEELAGKSGKVKITISYENTDEHRVSVNGKTVTMYTPFTVVCGTMFNNTENKNIEISNGKVVNDGTKTMVIGIAMPGMQESLNISRSKIEIPSSIEITVDTDKYEQNNIITFVTPKVFKEKISFNELNNLYSKVDEIQEASKKIEEGANTLKDGAITLSDGANTLNDKYAQFDEGINSAYAGSKELSDGTAKIDAGVSGLKEGTARLNAGVAQINEQLGAVDLSSLGTLVSGIQTLNAGVNGTEQTAGLTEGINGYVAGAEQVAGGVITLNSTLTTKINAAQNAYNQAVAAGDEISATKYGTALQTLQEIKASINVEGASLVAGAEQIQTSGSALTTGAQKVSNGVTALNQKTGDIQKLGGKVVELQKGLQTVQNGTETLNNKMSELKEGSEKVNNGSKALEEGLATLDTNSKVVKSALSQLSTGSSKITDGSIQLAEGITQFNTEAIDKIVNYVNSDVKDITARAEKLQELSEEYANFTKQAEGSAKEVKFILITDSIKVKDEKEEN